MGRAAYADAHAHIKAALKPADRWNFERKTKNDMPVFLSHRYVV